MRRMSMRRRAVGTCTLLALVTGCSGHVASPTPRAAPRPAKASTVSPAFDPKAVCAQRVPGARHAVETTVGQVRRQGLGLVGPTGAVRTFAASELASNPAAFCYRWLPARHLDEWWAASDSGATLRVGAFGGEQHDLGVFDGASFD